MDQDFNNQSQKSNRFIFSNEFYDQLDSIAEEENSSFDIHKMSPKSVEEPEKKERLEEPLETYSSFLSNGDQDYSSHEVSITSTPKLEEDRSSNSQFVNQIKEEKAEEPLETYSPFLSNRDKDYSSHEESITEEQKTKEKRPFGFDFLTRISQAKKQAEESQSKSVDLGKLESRNSNLNTTVEIPVSETKVNSEEELSKPKLSFVEPIQEKVSNNNALETIESNNNFNVETGIDTALEQEVLKSKVESQMKIPIVESTSFYENPTKEKMVYRATRNAAPITPVWLQEEIEKENQKENTNLSALENMIPDHTEVEATSKVINIDEELMKLTNQNPQSVVKKKIEYGENLSNLPVTKSDLLVQLKEKEHQTGKISILARYGEDFCSKDYIANPAIGRTEEIKQLMLVLLTPEKSAILVGKPGIGKTSIVEGLAYQLQRNNVPDALKGYCIVSIKTTSLLGTLPNGETRLQTMIDELKELDKIILFMDEIHMLMGATNESSLDFANMFKESLGRGSIKMIGATTNDEYERYVLRDKAFVRRFQRIDVEEPSREQTIKILMGTLPKIEKNTGAKLKYSDYVQSEIMAFIVDITTEYKRVYGIGSRYPDICLTLLTQAFSQAIFENRKEVNIFDIRKAIQNSKNIYPDVIRKELINFDHKFTNLIQEES